VNKFVKSLALALVLVMCMGVLVACGEDPTTPTNKPTTPTTLPAVEKDVVGIVKEISASFVILETYVNELDIIKYEKLDVYSLKLTGETDYVYVSSTAAYGHYTDGKLTDLKSSDLKVGDIVVITKTAKGVQQIVIMNYKAATAEPTQPTTPAN
jgi:hypothetical protein